MKIYHKNSLYMALTFFAIALFQVSQTLLNGREWTGSRVAQPVWLFCLGLYELYCAMNKKKAKELTIQDSDEMLVLERLKSYRAAFWTTFGLLLLVSTAALYLFDTPASRTVSLAADLAAMGMVLIYLLFLGSQTLHNS